MGFRERARGYESVSTLVFFEASTRLARPELGSLSIA